MDKSVRSTEAVHRRAKRRITLGSKRLGICATTVTERNVMKIISVQKLFCYKSYFAPYRSPDGLLTWHGLVHRVLCGKRTSISSTGTKSSHSQNMGASPPLSRLSGTRNEGLSACFERHWVFRKGNHLRQCRSTTRYLLLPQNLNHLSVLSIWHVTLTYCVNIILVIDEMTKRKRT